MDFTDYPQSVQTVPFALPRHFSFVFDTVVLCHVLATTHCQFPKASNAPLPKTPNYKQLT